MECRANNAEREAELLKEQLKHLKDQLDKCLHQKIEVEKKLSTLMFQEVASTESNVLVKHLQQELRNYNMACDTFLTGLPITIADLEPHQIHSFYESCQLQFLDVSTLHAALPDSTANSPLLKMLKSTLALKSKAS
ncbi:hypothetical protein JHK85_040176 [Glycine max]|nr:hypothetical protein JHK85_040176 [Glycine max]